MLVNDNRSGNSVLNAPVVDVPAESPTATTLSRKEEFIQFLGDYWEESKNFDPFVSFLAAWKVINPPVGFDQRRRTRTLLLAIQVMLVIGFAVQFGCKRNPMPKAVNVILTTMFATIPLQITNILWFQVVSKRSSVKVQAQSAGSGCERCLIWTRQFFSTSLATIFTTCLFILAVSFFVVAFAVPASKTGCDSEDRGVIVWNIVLYQFLMMPIFMSLPYWRDISPYLALLGPFGPILGAVIYIRRNGLHPPPRKEVTITSDPNPSPDEESANEASSVDYVENPIQIIQQSTGSPQSTGKVPMIQVQAPLGATPGTTMQNMNNGIIGFEASKSL